MSSLSRGSCRQMGPLYVRLTVRSGCMEEFRSRELPGKRKLICHSETKKYSYPFTPASTNCTATSVLALSSNQSQPFGATLCVQSGSVRLVISDQSFGILESGFHGDSLNATADKNFFTFQSSLHAIFSKQVFLALHQATNSGIFVYVILTGKEKLKKKDVL